MHTGTAVRGLYSCFHCFWLMIEITGGRTRMAKVRFQGRSSRPSLPSAVVSCARISANMIDQPLFGSVFREACVPHVEGGLVVRPVVHELPAQHLGRAPQAQVAAAGRGQIVEAVLEVG